MFSKFLRVIILSLVVVVCALCGVSESKLVDVQFCEVSEGKRLIIQDLGEAYIETLSTWDMQLQMQNFDSDTTNIHTQYPSFLESTVVSFSEKEKERLREVWQQILPSIRRLNPRIIEKPIRVIAQKPSPFGRSVLYTRGNIIFIPKGFAERHTKRVLSDILIHEIFHIYTRTLSVEQLQEMLRLFGYQYLSKQVLVSSKMKEQRLLNPDGLNNQWAFELDMNHSKQLLSPVLMSISRDTTLSFMEQMELRFYPLKETEHSFQYDETAYYKTADLPQLSEVFGDNTDYIIHPYEILADNFVLAVYLNADVEGSSDLSQKGGQLVSDFIKVLQK